MPGDFLRVEVVLLAVLGPELDTIPIYQGSAYKVEVLAQTHRLPKDFTDCFRIVSPEIGNGIVIKL